MLASSIAGMYVVTKGLPIGRRRKPEDIARVVLWLASKHAWFVVGHILVPVEGFPCREPLPQHPWLTAKRHRVWPAHRPPPLRTAFHCQYRDRVTGCKTKSIGEGTEPRSIARVGRKAGSRRRTPPHGKADLDGFTRAASARFRGFPWRIESCNLSSMNRGRLLNNLDRHWAQPLFEGGC